MLSVKVQSGGATTHAHGGVSELADLRDALCLSRRGSWGAPASYAPRATGAGRRRLKRQCLDMKGSVRRPSILGTVALLALVCAGCQVTGPTSVKRGRERYNEVVQRTNAEQLLLNLVRLRYRDSLYFLNVSSVSTSFSFDLDVGTRAQFGLGSGDDNLGANTGVRYGERPTITYLPVQGELFVRQFMTPVDANTLLLLYHSGWSIDRILRICVSYLGPFKNAPSASGPMPSLPPTYKEFLRLATIVQSLQNKGLLEFVAVPGESDAVALEIMPEALEQPEGRLLARLANLAPEQRRIVLHGRTRFFSEAEQDLRLPIVTRSLSATLFFLSQAIEVPEAHERAGIVSITRYPDGNRFDWKHVSGDLFQVRASAEKPDDSFISIKYRDHWFSIADDNLTAKSTFALLSQLFALKAGDANISASPLLTLPVQ